MMNWKYIITITLLLIGMQVTGQKATLFPDHGCGAPQPTIAQIKHTLEVVDKISLNKSSDMIHIPIRVHVVAKNDGSDAVDLTEVNSAIANLNTKFLPINVGFYIADINTILNTAFSDLDILTEENALAQPNEVPDAINMFFTHRLTTNIYDICGYAFYPYDNVRSLRIFIRNECTNDIGSGTIPHEIGHFLNLYHTFNGTSKGNTHYNAEHVARSGPNSNCSTHGDYLCDTEADPIGNINNECEYINLSQDVFGDTYTPPIGNMMSYYNKMCGGDFTPGQYNRMAQALQDRLTHTSYTLTNPIYSTVANPENIEASIGANYSIDITWDDVSDNETGFIVERSEDNGSTFQPLNNGGVAANVSLYCDTSVESNVDYIYRVKPSNGNPEVYGESNMIQSELTYCIPEYQPSSCDLLEIGVGIQRVQIGPNNELDHSSECDMHAVVPESTATLTLNTGSTQPFTVQLLESDGQYVEQNLAIWLDLNRDGEFDNQEELLCQSNYLTFGSQIINGSISIPDCVTPGSMTLRVRTRYMPYGQVESPCDFYHFGESEDYTVMINQVQPQFGQIALLEYSGEQDHDGLLCDGASATLIASGGVAYEWEDGSTNATRIVSETDIYRVTVYDDEGCSDSELIAIETNDSPVASIAIGGGSTQTAFCDNEDVQLIAEGGSSYLWEDGSNNASRLVNSSGLYLVTVSNAGGCSDQASIIVTIGNSVTPAIVIVENSGTTSNDGILCDGASATLSASGGVQYNWEDGSTSAQRTVSTSGTYQVTVTNSEGCTGVESVEIVAETLTGTSIEVNETSGLVNNDAILCYGDEAILTAVGGSDYQWEDGSTSAQRTVNEPGLYSVTISNQNGCSQIIEQLVSIENNILASIQVFEDSGSTSNDGVLCQGEEATILATGGLSYLWEDGSISNSRVVNESGTYTVEAFNAQGCSKLVSIEITVTQGNNAEIAFQETSGIANHDGIICSGDDVMLLVSGGVNYTWNVGSSASQILASEAGLYQVTVEDGNGCYHTANAEVTVTNPIEASIQSLDGSPISSTYCEGQTVTLIAEGGTGVQWDNGLTISTRAISQSGTYSATVYDDNGCTATAQVSIQFVNIADQDIQVVENSGSTNNDGILCSGDSATIIASGGDSYLWEDGSTNPQREVSESGTYTVVTTSNQGCESTGSIDIVIEQEASTAIAVYENSGNENNDAILCDGDEAVLTASGGIAYLWNNGAETAQIVVTETGNYSVEIANANGCSTSEDVFVQFNLIENYTIQITEQSGLFENDGLLCLGEDAVLSIEGGVSYTWDDLSIWSQRTVKSNGMYSVTLTNADGCIAEDSVEISYAPTIEQDILILEDNGNIASNVFCQGESVNLVAPSGTAYFWNNGSDQNQIEVSNSGIYEVSVIDSYGCANEMSTSVQVIEMQSVVLTIQEDSGIASNDGFLCNGDLATLSASGGIAYMWEDGSTNPTRVIAETGVYQVTVTSIDGCTNTASREIVIDAPIAANIAMFNQSGMPVASSICAGESVLLVVDGGYDIEWIDGGTDNPRSVYSSGVYTAEVLNQSGCFEFIDITVTIEEEVEASISVIESSGNFNNDGVLCSGDYATLNAEVGSQYLWSTGSITRQIQVSNAGEYSVTVTNENGCTNIASSSITVNEPSDLTIQMISASGDVVSGPFCSQDEVYLSIDTSDDVQWLDGSIANPRLINVSGVYAIELINSNGCSVVLEKEVQFQNQLSADIVIIEESGLSVNDGLLCQGDDALLVADGGAYYQWEDGSESEERLVSESGVYTVTVSDALGCQSTAQVEVIIEQSPDLALLVSEQSGLANDDGILCHGDVAVITAQGGNTYVWDNGTINPTRTVEESGFYSIQAFSEQGCKTVGIVSVDIMPELEPSIIIQEESGVSNDGKVCYGEAMLLTAVGGQSYSWNNGSTEANLEVTQSGTYTVEVADIQGCVATESIDVIIEDEINAVISISENSGSEQNDGILCYGDVAVVTIDGGVRYLWSDGSEAQQRTIEESGVYSVEIYNAFDCYITEHVVIEFNQSSATTIAIVETSGDIDNDGYLCYGDAATLVATGGESFVWEDGYVGAQRVVNQSGTYRVITTNKSGCDDVAEAVISIADQLEARIEATDSTGELLGDEPLCYGEVITLRAVANVDIVWEDGSTALDREVSESGTYRIIATHPNGCVKEEELTIAFSDVVNASMQINNIEVTDIITLCHGESVLVEAIGGSLIVWNDGSTLPKRELSESGIYTATVANVSGCSEEVSVEVIVNEALPATINILETSGLDQNDGILCEGDFAILEVSEGFEYIWEDGQDTRSIEVQESGVYRVSISNTAGCTTIQEVTVETRSNPNAEIIVMNNDGTINDGNTAVGCEGEQFLLKASGGENYVWDNGAINLNRIVTETGTYTATVTNANGCAVEESKEVIFNANPEITLDIVNQDGVEVYDGYLLYGDTAHMTATGGLTYLWSTGETDETILVDQEGYVSVEGVDRYGCTGEASINMYFSIILSLSDMSIYIEHDDNTNTLTWTMPEDLNVGEYKIERRINNGEFVEIATVDSQMSIHDPIYSIEDEELTQAGDYYYRINTVSTNGDSEYSKVVHVVVDSLTVGQSASMHVYPNPSRGIVNIDLPKYSDEECAVNLRVSNELGATVYTEVLAGDQYAMVETYNVNLAGLGTGIYLLEVIRCNSRTIERIIITD